MNVEALATAASTQQLEATAANSSVRPVAEIGHSEEPSRIGLGTNNDVKAGSQLEGTDWSGCGEHTLPIGPPAPFCRLFRDDSPCELAALRPEHTWKRCGPVDRSILYTEPQGYLYTNARA